MPAFSGTLLMPGSTGGVFPISGGGFDHGYYILHESGRLTECTSILFQVLVLIILFIWLQIMVSMRINVEEEKSAFQLVKWYKICMLYDCT